jgi:hypothetical protein
VAVSADGFLEPTQSAVDFAEIGMSNRIRRCKGHDPLHPIQGEVAATYLERQQTEMMQGIGMARLSGQNLPIDRLRFAQAARLMVLRGDCKRLLDIGWGHGWPQVASRFGDLQPHEK